MAPGVAGYTTYDAEADAAYVHLGRMPAAGSVHQTISGIVLRRPGTDVATGTVNLDLDADGRLIGIEVLGARTALTASVIERAVRLDG